MMGDHTKPADIIVPIDVSAFHVPAEGKNAAASVADVRPQFELTPYFDGSMQQGPAHVPPITELFRPKEFAILPVAQSLEAGVHLHWALPAALTRVEMKADGTFAYPAAPNRWRVTRQWSVKGTRRSRTWCIESDALSLHQVGDMGSVVPVVPDETASGPLLAPFRTLGLVADEGDYREGAASDYLRPFTCVGHGEAAFASLYGQCRNVFGLYDALDDQAADSTVSYLVVGWHDNSADDPLCQQDRERLLREWDVPRSAPARTYYCGHVGEVQIDGAPPAVPSADQLDVAVGNTVAEALSAMLIPEGTGINAERVLTMLQAGQLTGLDTVATLETVDEVLHRAEFGTQHGGHVYTVRRIGDGAIHGPTRASLMGQAEMPAKILPVASAVALDRANTASAAFTGAKRAQKAAQRQLFADWVKYLNVTYLPGQIISAADAANYLARSTNALATLNTQIKLARDNLVRSERALTTSLRANGAAFELVVNTAAPFYLAHDPVIAVRGAALSPSRRLRMRRGPLRCLDRGQLGLAEGGALYQVLADYVVSNRQDAIVQGLSVNWEQPWLPVLLQWECNYVPACALKGTAGQYAASDIIDRFQLTDADTELTIKGAWPTLGSTSFAVTGTVPVSSQAATPLWKQAQTYLESNPRDAQIAALVTSVRDASIPCVAQMAHGLQDGLIQRQQFLQLSVYDPLSTDIGDPSPAVAAVVKNAVRQGAAVDNPFSSLRAGTAQFTRLRLIDAFGQYVDLDAKAIKVSETLGLKDAANPSLLGLPPRVAQALRMELAFTCPTLGIDTNAVPASSPIFGWVLYNHLNDAVDLYDKRGCAIGSLSRIGELWRPPVGPSPAVAEGDLLAFVNAVRQAADPASYLRGLIAAIDGASASISLPGRDGDPSLARLISRAFALGTMRVRLEAAHALPAKEDLTAFGSLVAGGVRDTASLGKVRFPILLGDPGRGGDGLVAVFQSKRGTDNSAIDFGTCYVVDPTSVVGTNCLPFDDTTLSLSLEDQANIAVLFDPHGCVSVHSGILPVTTARLRPEHYAGALGELHVELSIAPWLRAGHPALRAPSIKGYEVCYIRCLDGKWFELPLDQASTTTQLPVEPLSVEEAWVLLKPRKGGR